MFLDLPQSSEELASVILLPLPYDGTASYGKGTAAGPAAVLAASTQIELWDEELDFDLDSIAFHTAAAIDPLGAESPEQYVTRVFDAARQLRQRSSSSLLVGIGGEHSVTPSLVRAAARRQTDLSSISVVQFDAHADLRREYEGTAASHACAMRRVVELGARVVAVGIRSAERAEFAYGVETGRVETYFAKELATEPTAAEKLRSRLRGLSGEVYLTIDIDCLDLPYCSATGTPQPGGLGWWQILDFLKCILFENQQSRLIGCDIVETSPQVGTSTNEFTTAKLLCKILAYHFADSARP